MNRCTQLDEILHAHVPQSTTSRTVLNFKVIGHRVFWVFFCVCNAAATRGQYLALSKA